MCCFSVASPVGWLSRLLRVLTPQVQVSATNIFARMLQPGVQALAYGMNLDSKQAVAMVLPLPVAPGSGEDAVTFVDLTQHPRMFEGWQMMFEAPPLQMRKGRSPSISRQRLWARRSLPSASISANFRSSLVSSSGVCNATRRSRLL